MDLYIKTSSHFALLGDHDDEACLTSRGFIFELDTLLTCFKVAPWTRTIS